MDRTQVVVPAADIRRQREFIEKLAEIHRREGRAEMGIVYCLV